MVVGWPHRIGVLAQVCRSASHGFTFEIEVVVGGTHLEFNLSFSRCCDVHVNCHFGVHSSGRVWCILSCVWLCVCWLCVPLGWGDRLSTPQVQRLLLHIPWLLRRKRDCTPALFLTISVCTSTLSCSSEEEGLAHSLLPHNGEEFTGGGGTGPPSHISGEYIGRPLPHNVGTFDDYMLAVQCRLFVGKIELDC